ncbi:hypothetical protein FHG87_006019 [Trinorchestia longiramus]|nr:hypothetical protein FHG87_006019 [Trinorchestia longiramus]
MATRVLRFMTLLMLLATTSVLGADDGSEDEVLVCYTCTMSGGTDDSCFTDPENSGSTPTTECKLGAGQCCMTSRTDSTEDPGNPLSMYRGCIPDCDPDLIGQLVTTDTYAVTTYETYCDEDYCNNGAGDTKPGGGSGGGTYIDNIAGVVNGGARLQAAPLVQGWLCLSLLWHMF